jgi:hypothetical protein
MKKINLKKVSGGLSVNISGNIKGNVSAVENMPVSSIDTFDADNWFSSSLRLRNNL